MLRDDPRLDAPVTLADVYRPLPEILSSMQRQCHVKLAASPAVAANVRSSGSQRATRGTLPAAAGDEGEPKPTSTK